MMLFVD